MTEHQHKILSALIISVITFLGFDALFLIVGLYQIHIYLQVAIYIFVFHIFWITFMFDLHLRNRVPASISSLRFWHMVGTAFVQRFEHFKKWQYIRHYLNYLILPSLIYWAVVVLLLLNPFYSGLKQAIIIVGSYILVVVYWYMKEHLTFKLEHTNNWLKTLAAIKLIGAFLVYSAVLGLVWYHGLSSTMLFYLIAATSFAIMYQALFSHGYHSPGTILTILLSSIAISFVSLWIYHNWNYQYFTAALVLLAVYNLVWGFVHHYLDKTISTSMIVEYILLTVLFISILVATHNFAVRIS